MTGICLILLPIYNNNVQNLTNNFINHELMNITLQSEAMKDNDFKRHYIYEPYREKPAFDTSTISGTNWHAQPKKMATGLKFQI